MKKLILFIFAFVFSINIQAQQAKFSPEKFEAELVSYITKEANLSHQEASIFFPIYKEMREKQRLLFLKQRSIAKKKPQDEKGCLKAIKERDQIDVELKELQKAYHEKFLKSLSASKVYDILKAEDRFHRKMMKNWENNRPMNKRAKH
ncbi:hypothetical protein L6472_06655 [Prevotella sp. E13-17]|uniref:hypothetical protein n=1 Tax=Prevotella sp. E13-17 TaxID=2913616 RepID=UPI001EDA2B82|nr:hypothetical protein [Prevotella sp. E13-17]UKK52253.1 hypothetical protein L6472_06655 [Prevotella sp. E13-17]